MAALGDAALQRSKAQPKVRFGPTPSLSPPPNQVMLRRIR